MQEAGDKVYMISIFILTVLLVAIVLVLWCLRGFRRASKEQKFVGILVRSEETHMVEPAQNQEQNVRSESRPESRSGMSRSSPGMIAPDFHRQVSQKREGCKSHHPAGVA
jgi:hypothetical protein